MNRRVRRRIKPVLQMSETDCGAACLTMILNFHGCELSLFDVSERCGAGRDGTTALALVEAARDHGLTVKAVSLAPGDFRAVPLPAIVYWQPRHFVVVERWSPERVHVVDPAHGRRGLNVQEFEAAFGKIVLVLEPGDSFVPLKSVRRFTWRDYFGSVLQARRLLAHIVAASLILQLMGLAVPLFTAAIVDSVVPSNREGLLHWCGLGLLLLVIGHGATSYVRSRLLIQLQVRTDERIMTGFFQHLQSLPYRYFQTRTSGDLLERFASNVAIRETLSQDVLSMILDGGLVLMYLIVLLWHAPLMASMVGVLAGLQAILLLATHRKLGHLERSCLDVRARSAAYLVEAIAGIATIKAAGAEARSFRHWSALFSQQLTATAHRDRAEAKVGAGLVVLGALAPLLLLWSGAWQVLHGTMSLGTMFAVNGLALGFLTPFGSLLASGQQCHLASAHLNRVLDVLGVPPEQDPRFIQSPPPLTGLIELRNVSFSYGPRDPKVLDRINLRVEAGQTVAIVGKTGSGKSTLAKLLVGLYQPTDGEVLYEGVPLCDLNLSQVRQQLGIVLQDAHVFAGTIRENIAFNAPDMPPGQVREAGRLAALAPDIEAMPMGYETFVAEGGSALSGGQRQRLAIARAVSHRPAVVLLDEATSHLDAQTELTIGKNLSSLRCTRLIIAHRLSTLRDADVIVVLDGGRIVELGTHAELIARRGTYHQLFAGWDETSIVGPACPMVAQS